MAFKNILPKLRNILSPARRFTSEGERILQSQMAEHGPGSLFLYPVKKILDRISPQRRIGSKLTYSMSAGPEEVNRRIGEFFRGVPVAEKIFRRKITPGEVGEAVGHLQKQYGYTPKQIVDLTQKAKGGDVASYRLTAPFETIGKRFVLPMAGAAYLHGKLDEYKKRKALERPYEEAAENRLKALEQLAGLNKEGEFVVSQQSDMMQKAASTLKRLRSSNSDLQSERDEALQKIASLNEELDMAKNIISLQKEAMVMVADGSLDPSQADEWIEGNMTKTSSVQKTSQIPNYAFIGQLDESNSPPARETGGMQPVGMTAHQAFFSQLLGNQ